MVGIHLTIPRSFVPISSDPISTKVFKKKHEKRKVQIVTSVLLIQNLVPQIQGKAQFEGIREQSAEESRKEKQGKEEKCAIRNFLNNY